MRALLIPLLLICGCASTLPATRSAAKSEAICEDLGRVVYNARNPVLDPTQTIGPSAVYWFREKPGGYFTVHDGHAYRCSKPT